MLLDCYRQKQPLLAVAFADSVLTGQIEFQLAQIPAAWREARLPA
jgi:hypothetical protein